MEKSQIIEICEQIVLGKMSNWISVPMNGKQRLQIHMWVEVYDELRTESEIVEGTEGLKRVGIFLNDKPGFEYNSSPSKPIQFTMTKERVDFFNKFSKLPIPTNSPEHLDYYINLMDKYYNARSTYTNFEHDMQKIGYSQLKSRINVVKSNIISSIKDNEDYKEFINPTNIIKPKYPVGYVGKSSIYNHTNSNQYFISIDIRSANWTCLKRFCKNFTGSWSEFASKFTMSKFLQNSKYFREYVFGELGSKKLEQFIPDFVFDIETIISTDLEEYRWSFVKKVSSTRDEIIYRFDLSNDLEDKHIMYEQIYNKICDIANLIDATNSTYRVELFLLKQLEPRDFFVKEIIKSNDANSPKIQFKQVPKHYICQAIKHYEGVPIELPDKKFMFENSICSFDDELEWNDKST